MSGAAAWRYTRDNPCPNCYGWSLGEESTCRHKKYVCPVCGRKQCMLHWPYPMGTEQEAVHFLKSAEVRTGKRCFVRKVVLGPKMEKWKIFTSQEDYESYVKTRKHKR